MPKKIEIVLITGFLGSGKTTLLNRFIQQTSKLNIGILINDFGKIPVDSVLIKSKFKHYENKIFEISNGSIFCSCKTDEFVEGLNYFSKQKPELLLIETSGLSDPSSIFKILKDNQLDSNFVIKSTICLVDPQTTNKLINTLTAIKKQITFSQFIIINKIDLVTKVELENLTAEIITLNLKATIIETEFAGIDFDQVLQQSIYPIPTELESCNKLENRPGSFIIPQKEISMESLTKFLNHIQDRTYRIKGFYSIENSVYYINNNNRYIEFTQANNLPQEKFGLDVLYPIDEAREIFKVWHNANH